MNAPTASALQIANRSASSYKRMLLAWFALLLACVAYCELHEIATGTFSGRLGVSLGWAIRNWGSWPILLPICLWAVRSFQARGELVRGIVVVALFALVGATAFAAVIDRTLGGAMSLSELVFYMTPIASGTYCFFMVLAFSVRHQVPENVQPAEAVPKTGACRTLDVSKGTREVKLRVSDISWVKAAGNYVEIFTDSDAYILRIRMKDVEELLAPNCFIRIHRSYLVNINYVKNLCCADTGTAVVLSSSKRLPVGRKYRADARQAIRANMQRI